MDKYSKRKEGGGGGDLSIARGGVFSKKNNLYVKIIFLNFIMSPYDIFNFIFNIRLFFSTFSLNDFISKINNISMDLDDEKITCLIC